MRSFKYPFQVLECRSIFSAILASTSPGTKFSYVFKQYKTFSVFAQPDINTRLVGRIRDSYANPRRSRGLHNCREFSQPSSIYIRICKHRKNVFFCFYKITFPRKKTKTPLFKALIKREILTSREVLYAKLVREISLCFAKKMLSKIRVFLA